MNKVFLKLALSVILVISFAALVAQTNIALNSGEFRAQGSKLRYAGKYKEAFGIYKKIPHSHTNYRRALYRSLSGNYAYDDCHAPPKAGPIFSR